MDRSMDTDVVVPGVGTCGEDASLLQELGAWFRGWLHRDDSAGLIKLIFEPTGDRLVGATVMGLNGGEVMGMLSLADHARLPLETLRSMVYAFATLHGAIGEAIGACGRGLVTVLDPANDGIARLDAAMGA